MVVDFLQGTIVPGHSSVSDAGGIPATTSLTVTDVTVKTGHGGASFLGNFLPKSGGAQQEFNATEYALTTSRASAPGPASTISQTMIRMAVNNVTINPATVALSVVDGATTKTGHGQSSYDGFLTYIRSRGFIGSAGAYAPALLGSVTHSVVTLQQGFAASLSLNCFVTGTSLSPLNGTFECDFSLSCIAAPSPTIVGRFSSGLQLSSSVIGTGLFQGIFESDLALSSSFVPSGNFSGAYESDMVFSSVVSGSGVLNGMVESDMQLSATFVGRVPAVASGGLNGSGVAVRNPPLASASQGGNYVF